MNWARWERGVSPSIIDGEDSSTVAIGQLQCTNLHTKKFGRPPKPLQGPPKASPHHSPLESRLACVRVPRANLTHVSADLDKTSPDQPKTKPAAEEALPERRGVLRGSHR